MPLHHCQLLFGLRRSAASQGIPLCVLCYTSALPLVSLPLQVDLINLLQGGRGQLTAVGDDDQSIMSFLHAVPSVFGDLRRAYPSLQEVALAANYRCGRGAAQQRFCRPIAGSRGGAWI